MAHHNGAYVGSGECITVCTPKATNQIFCSTSMLLWFASMRYYYARIVCVRSAPFGTCLSIVRYVREYLGAIRSMLR